MRIAPQLPWAVPIHPITQPPGGPHCIGLHWPPHVRKTLPLQPRYAVTRAGGSMRVLAFRAAIACLHQPGAREQRPGHGQDCRCSHGQIPCLSTRQPDRPLANDLRSASWSPISVGVALRGRLQLGFWRWAWFSPSRLWLHQGATRGTSTPGPPAGRTDSVAGRTTMLSFIPISTSPTTVARRAAPRARRRLGALPPGGRSRHAQALPSPERPRPGMQTGRW
jgi:hypothetical protein